MSSSALNRITTSPKVGLGALSKSVRRIAIMAAALVAVSAGAETIKLVATQNAQIEAAEPDNPIQDVGVLDVFSYNGPNSLRRVLLQFDLSAIPSGASLTSAKLGIFARGSGVALDASQEVWRAENDGWSQSTATWNNFASGQSNYLAGLGTIIGPGYNVWDLDLNGWNTAADLADGKLTVLVKFSAALEGGLCLPGCSILQPGGAQCQ